MARDRTNLFWDALDARVARLELNLAIAGCLASVIGAGLSSYVAVVLDRQMGAMLLALTVVSLFWFGCTWYLLRQDRFVGILKVLNPAFEMFLPTLATWVLFEVRGVEYALGSWVPPMIYTLFIAASLMRLRPLLPALMGMLAAGGWGVVYFLAILPELGAQPDLLHQPRMQVVRMATLVLVGMVGTLTVVAVRTAIAMAGREARAQDLFGKYQLVRSIASGGMGTVHEAIYCPEGGFERKVAVKIIHPHLAEDPDFVDRFRREARLAAQLAHPHIVAALDFGRVDETYFFAMEYVGGPTLKDLLAHHNVIEMQLPTNVVATIGLQILDALVYAHEEAVDRKGRLLAVVHRDLSPANILFAKSGAAKLADFGVARLLRDRGPLHTQHLAGKPSYMAPEQVRQDAIDGRTDLFAVGILLWEMLVNRRLFYRDNQAATSLAVVEDDIPAPSTHRPELSEAWDAFVMRALERDPQDRFQTATEMRFALQAIAAAEPAVNDKTLAHLTAAARSDEVEELSLDLTIS